MHRSVNNLTTADLNGRAAAVLSDPDTSPVDPTIAEPLAKLLNTLTTASTRHGAPTPGFDQTRPLALAILWAVADDTRQAAS